MRCTSACHASMSVRWTTLHTPAWVSTLLNITLITQALHIGYILYVLAVKLFIFEVGSTYSSCTMLFPITVVNEIILHITGYTILIVNMTNQNMTNVKVAKVTNQFLVSNFYCSVIYLLKWDTSAYYFSSTIIPSIITYYIHSSFTYYFHSSLLPSSQKWILIFHSCCCFSCMWN